MKLFRMERELKETISEILIVFRKMGFPFMILGGAFLIYSWMDGKPAVPFKEFMMLFFFLILIMVMFENLWLQKEINKLKKKLEKVERNYKDKC